MLTKSDHVYDTHKKVSQNKYDTHKRLSQLLLAVLIGGSCLLMYFFLSKFGFLQVRMQGNSKWANMQGFELYSD
jgi:hypothetical protein